jgi:DNA helicase-2/ATP-dependent DNA helicase PcrA
MGLLYRSNAQSRVLEHLLFSVGVPYRVYGGLRFFERKEIKHALAYLRLIANPDDNGSLSHIINFPPRGIGTRSLEQLETVAQTQGVSMLKAVQYMGEAKGSLKSFAALMVDLQQACATLPLPQQVDHVLYHSGLPTHYQKEKNGEERVENLHELVNAATLFAQEYRDNSPVEDRNRAGFKDVLTAFLSHASLEAGEHQAQEGVDALQLMTVHSAKGLEFDTVFMSGLEEGLFPHDNSLSDPDGLEEERRLMYVAITRAKKQLFISFAQSRMLHGQTRYGIASRFLGEIPAAFIKYAGASWRNLYTSLTVDPIPAPRAAAAVSKAPAFSIGQSVMHPKFGLGIIMNCEGRGADARVQVSFANAGVKWLALEYAKLSPG